MGEEEQEEESCPDSKTAKALVGASYRLQEHCAFRVFCLSPVRCPPFPTMPCNLPSNNSGYAVSSVAALTRQRVKLGWGGLWSFSFAEESGPMLTWTVG